MEYPKRKKSLFHRPRKLGFQYRYPRLFYWGLVSVSMSILFSKVIYDAFTVKPLIDPATLDPETRREIVRMGQKLYTTREDMLLRIKQREEEKERMKRDA